jgi:hypothetical protein
MSRQLKKLLEMAFSRNSCCIRSLKRKLKHGDGGWFKNTVSTPVTLARCAPSAVPSCRSAAQDFGFLSGCLCSSLGDECTRWSVILVSRCFGSGPSRTGAYRGSRPRADYD